MANPIITYPLGANDPTLWTVDAKIAVGTRAMGSDGSEWIYVQAGAALTAGYWVAVSGAFAALHLTKTLANQGQLIGVVDARSGTVTISYYGWVQVNGLAAAALEALSAKNIALYTTEVDGVLGVSASDVGTTNQKIIGAVAFQSAAGTQSAHLCLLNSPHVVL